VDSTRYIEGLTMDLDFWWNFRFPNSMLGLNFENAANHTFKFVASTQLPVLPEPLTERMSNLNLKPLNLQMQYMIGVITIIIGVDGPLLPSQIPLQVSSTRSRV
jgi:hypothetical protein